MTNPWGSVIGAERTGCGGSWLNIAMKERVAGRDGSTPDDRVNNVGFRPSGTGATCEVQIRYHAPSGDSDLGFEMEFTCNHIDMTHTDYHLVTIGEDGNMGPGTLAMGGCSTE